jgi:cyclohexadieny/prephenate dehydrogenase
MAEPVFERLVLIGIGLIGSSIARGARAFGLARQLVICDASPQALARAAELELGDVY